MGGDDDWDDDFMDSDDDPSGKGSPVERKPPVQESSFDPDNFSRVDLSLSDTELARKFPNFPVRLPRALPAFNLRRCQLIICICCSDTSTGNPS